MTSPAAPVDTIPHRLLRQAVDRPDAVAYQAKVAGRWQATTYRAFVAEVRTAARALIALGLPAGGVVSLLGFNRPEWVIVAHATMMAGGAAAGIYTTSSPEEVHYIVDHSEAVVILVEDAAQLAKVQARRADLPRCRHVVLMRGTAAPGDDVLSWDAFLAHAAATPEAALDERLASLAPTDLASLIYTSGTTGPPKGVMLSHGNLAWTARALLDVGGSVEGDVGLSYLPLSHIAEQTASIHMPATAGSTVYFAESIEKVADNLKDARPTVFFGVPRIWEKFHAALAAKLGELTGAKQRLVAWARVVCADVNAHRARGTAVPRLLDVQYRLAQRLVIGKLKVALGLDRARVLLSGAAPIAPDVLAFFASLDLPIQEIYGQAEGCGPTSFNLPGKTRLGSVGPPLPGLEVTLAPDGEILVRGPNVFIGYFKEPAATAEVRVDGWLHSGDLGVFDADGFLSITGRKKEIIITAGGKNIAPKNIEAALKQLPLITEAVVIGDRRHYLTALVTVDEVLAAALTPEAIRAQVQAQVDLVNPTLARVEQIKKFAVLPRAFSLDTGELTPTLKLRRMVIAARYEREIEAMYAGGHA